jgi:hypothetical protein
MEKIYYCNKKNVVTFSKVKLQNVASNIICGLICNENYQ